MARDALYFLIPLLAAAAAAVWAGWTLAGLALAPLAAFVAFFFRDPDRVVPTGPGVIVAPADGRIVGVETEADGSTTVSIFLSLFNVHVNRSPIEGQVQKVQYRKGAFHMAFTDVSSAENERNTLTIANSDFGVTCAQIAGVLARRIVCWKGPGDTVGRGERIGLIRFGSRVELRMPRGVSLKVGAGDRVRGGASTIGVMETRRRGEDERGR